MLRLFQLAQERELDIHPQALRAVTQNLRRIDPELREIARGERPVHGDADRAQGPGKHAAGG